MILLEKVYDDILKQIREIRETITEEELKNTNGEDLISYLMEVHRLESLIMTAIDDVSKDVK